jgi:hypothetical protein
MKPEDYLKRIEQIIASQQTVKKRPIWIYAHYQELCASPKSAQPQPANLICTLSLKDLNHGPTRAKWNGIDTRIRALLSRGALA